MAFDAPFSEFFITEFELCHPAWARVHAWARAEIDKCDEEEFWHSFVSEWLSRLAVGLGGSYTAREGSNFFLLSDSGAKADAEFLGRAERARSAMYRTFGERLSPGDAAGKHVVLLFTNEYDYCRYRARYAPDGVSATSGGVCIMEGYVHIAMPRSELMFATFVHEFSHNLTYRLPLPPWLNEGVAMMMESDIGGSPYAAADEFLETRDFWNHETIQRFWYGEAFTSVEGQRAAYALAATLFRTMIVDMRPSPISLQKFLLASDFRDAGAFACRKFLGTAIESVAARVLGVGDWAPNPAAWKSQHDSGDKLSDSEGVPDENGFIWPAGLEPDR